MNKGITNLEINKFFENEENQDIKNNYMGVYSIDSITGYINCYEIIKKKKWKICICNFQYRSTQETCHALVEFCGYSPKKMSSTI